MENRKKEGYWYTGAKDCNYPMPIANQLNEEQALDIYNKIREKEKIAYKTLQRGFSYSRLTKEPLGCSEYALGNWSWAGDFAEHYVLKHKVKPSDEFIEFLNETPKAKLTEYKEKLIKKWERTEAENRIYRRR